MKHRSSLHRRLVLFMFYTLLLASMSTASICIFVTNFGFLRPMRLPPLTLPLISLGVSTLLGTLLSAPIARYYLAPISELIAATREVKSGNFDVRVELEDTGGEIAMLADCFNEMTRELGTIELFRSDFINSFSHEFKTPIVSIRGFARQLERDDLTPEQRREYLSIIIAESDRLSTMATNVLLLTKLESQQIVSDKAPYRLDEQLRSAILLLENQWTEKNLDLNVELDEVTFTGNEEMVAHVWINLLNNAIKFSDTGGLLEISLAQEGGSAVARITDHGAGMDEVTRAHMFEKFYQGDTSHAMHGNGLGLSLVKRIVELCCGEISVESTLGQGSTFMVKMPLES